MVRTERFGPAFARRGVAPESGRPTEERSMSLHDGRPWEEEGDLPWDTPDAEWEPAESEAWRGDLHLDDWPENLAGPEYWLFKNQSDDE
jgi:hypothetical protein